jgi:hypothetical protein
MAVASGGKQEVLLDIPNGVLTVFPRTAGGPIERITGRLLLTGLWVIVYTADGTTRAINASQVSEVTQLP